MFHRFESYEYFLLQEFDIIVLEQHQANLAVVRCCRLDTNIASMCSTNAELASKAGRADLVQMWSLLALTVPPALDPSPNPDHEPWASHPFGRQLIKSL